MSSFEGENMQTQYNLLSYTIDENGHCDKNIDYKRKRQKVIKQELGCQFIRIDPDKKDFDSFKTVNDIFKHITQSTKKTVINKISKRLLQ